MRTAETRRSEAGSSGSLAKMLPMCLRTAASLTTSATPTKSVRRIEVADNAVGQQENSHRNRGQRHQSNVDDAMQPLPGMAEGTFRQVGFIVAPHLGSNT